MRVLNVLPVREPIIMMVWEAEIEIIAFSLLCSRNKFSMGILLRRGPITVVLWEHSVEKELCRGGGETLH